MPKKSTKPSLEHLVRLTDDTGLIQHAKFIIPDRFNGYCTDDNARAAIVMVKYLEKYPAESQALKLFEIYLAFLYHALKLDKTVYNFMDYNRNWKANDIPGDALGRIVWAFGSLIASPPDDAYVPVVREFFQDTSKHISRMSLRGMAYSMLGQAEYLTKFPDAKEEKELLVFAANKLVELYKKNSAADWDWFEDILSYDNAILPAALFTAGKVLNEKKYISIAQNTCKFLLDNTYNGRHFSFIGSFGWYPKGKARAQFDQQPIEVASTVLMLKLAYEATGDKEYLTLQAKAFDWFFGENDLRMAVYDVKTGGCCDGIGDGGVNINQGAESLVSFLLASLFMV